MQNSYTLKKLRSKKGLFLHEHLHQAIIENKVNSKYIPPRPQLRNESNEEYIKRLAKESSTYQFVSIKTKNGIKYISFGVPGPIITAYGEFFVIPAEVVGGSWGIHYFMLYPGLASVLKNNYTTMRMDSGCFSGMVLGDMLCDCLQQLRTAQKLCVEKGTGIVVEIPGHDGRGWGEYKMANQKIIRGLGYDTIKAAENFYGDKKWIDIRTYDEATLILKALGFEKGQKFNLETNNPFKIKAFRDAGFTVNENLTLRAEPAHKLAQKHISAKIKFWKEVTSAGKNNPEDQYV